MWRSSLALCWAIALCGFPGLVAADQVTPSPRVVNYVNVQAGAAAATDIISELYPGERVEFVAVRGAWYEVRLNSGQPGFVSRSWMVRVASTPAAATTPPFRVHFIDVGTGDAAIIDIGDREIVIDGGNYVNDITTYARDLAIIDGPIELLVITHADSDHWKGLPRLLGLDGANPTPVSVLEVWEPGYDRACNPLASYDALIAGLHSLGAAVRRPLEATHAPATLTGAPTAVQLTSLPGVTLTVLHSDDTPPASNDDCPYRINNASIVLRIDIGPHRFLFTGDANEKDRNEQSPGTPGHIEQMLLRVEQAHPGTLRADVIKVPHHGSETASTQAFIDAVNPRFAVFSPSTTHHLPRHTTVHRYMTNTRVILRTDTTPARMTDHIVCSVNAQGALDCNYSALLNE
jgi:beta-lactamase superfamily II metal-dependent hydrolase